MKRDKEIGLNREIKKNLRWKRRELEDEMKIRGQMN
jgi:hypothetical protein